MLKFYSNLNSRNRTIFDISIILLASVIITLPFYFFGIPGGVDLFQHFQFGQTYFESIKAGTFYPSWADQTNFGFGDVSVRFYPPLAYYFYSFFRLITGNWADGHYLMITFLFFLSGVGVYIWMREFFNQPAALVGALIYIILPYHNIQIYQFAFLAEFTTASILPFCFLFATRVCRKGRMIDICGLAISFGLIILSHLPTTIMLSFVLAVYCLFLMKKASFFQTLLKLVTSVLLSVLLSSFYWIRMVTELDWVQHNSKMFSTEYFLYKANFVFARYFESLLGIDVSYNFRFDYVLLITLGIMIPALVTIFTSPKSKEYLLIIGVLLSSIFIIFMVTPLSVKVWDLLPTLQKIQFPWRWLILFSLFCSFFVSASFERVLENLKTPKRPLSFLAIGMLLICIPFHYFVVMGHYFFYPKDYLNPVVEKFKTNPSYFCWWTIWAVASTAENAKIGMPRPYILPEKAVLNDRTLTVHTWAATDRSFSLAPGAAGQVLVATFYYPHWKATVNGQAVEVTPNEVGLISFPVPAEQSDIKLYFQEPSFIVNTFYLAGFSWFLMFCFLLFHAFQMFKKHDDTRIN